MSKPNKHVIRTSELNPFGQRRRYYFTSKSQAREFCRKWGLPYSQIKKL